jgi:hypothetical protein
LYRYEDDPEIIQRDLDLKGNIDLPTYMQFALAIDEQGKGSLGLRALLLRPQSDVAGFQSLIEKATFKYLAARPEYAGKDQQTIVQDAQYLTTGLFATILTENADANFARIVQAKLPGF